MTKKQEKKNKSLIFSPQVGYCVDDSSLVDGTEMRSGFVQDRCLKCGGNVYLDRDGYGWYEQCLQCSCTRYLETMIDLQEPVRSS